MTKKNDSAKKNRQKNMRLVNFAFRTSLIVTVVGTLFVMYVCYREIAGVSSLLIF